MEKKMSLSFTTIVSILTLGVISAAAPASAATLPKVPSCQTVGGAIEAALSGPIERVTDDTAGAHEAEGQSTGDPLPYHVLRACSVYVPGHEIPLVVTFNAPVTKQFITLQVQVAKHMGLNAHRLDGGAYGDFAYLIPQVGGGNATAALVGPVDISLTTWADTRSVEEMTKNLVALLR
ncbi:hypothetical protein KY084_13025 [Stakelama sp. CBK3Z-3]|uniref:Uncharacterized protein n=1 Tax=Stakelama flava TaxID=2860338 RepID=A0ABS6XNI8_9SPHN|nr:hypothetical protein [Stakelama flava]MBW4331790.1 hypothetical protein [Stakelama flava]